MVDVHTIGAGGGAIAWLDGGGNLRVGPRSAGARPGPACYGEGGTDQTRIAFGPRENFVQNFLRLLGDPATVAEAWGVKPSA